METRFHYSERPCAPGLRPWLWNYWEFWVETGAGEPVPYHVPPDGSTSVALVIESGIPRHLAASGPWLEPFVTPVLPHCRYWGVRCRPEGGGLALGTRPEQLSNQNQPLDRVAPRLDRELRRAIAQVPDFDGAVMAMDRVFGDHLAAADRPDVMARDAVNQFVATAGEATIAEVAARLGTSPRTLLRRFRAATGLAPKQFARICRFRLAALTLVGGDRPGWAQVASGTGFADQAHMIHEFRDLTGLTPEGLGERIRQTSHGDLIG